jgi:hypothetical protein
MTGENVEIKFKLFCFNPDISPQDAISEMDKVAYRPANLMELLALGAAYPELQRQFLIIAPGSIWPATGGSHFVTGLSVCGSKRWLLLVWLYGFIKGNCRFLGTPKASQAI